MAIDLISSSGFLCQCTCDPFHPCLAFSLYISVMFTVHTPPSTPPSLSQRLPPPSLFSAVPVLSSCTISSPGHTEAARASGSKNHPCGVVRARPSPRANGTKRRMWRPQIHRLAVTSTLAPGMSVDSIAPPGLLTKTRPCARPMPLPEGTYCPLLSRTADKPICLITQIIC